MWNLSICLFMNCKLKKKTLPCVTFNIKWVLNINRAYRERKRDRKLRTHRFRKENNMNREDWHLQQDKYIRMICPCAYRLFISTSSPPDGGKRAERIRVVLLRVSGGLREISKLVHCHKLVRPRHFDQALSEIMRSLFHKFQQNSSTSMLLYIVSFLNKDTKCNLQAPLKIIITDTASVF